MVVAQATQTCWWKIMWDKTCFYRIAFSTYRFSTAIMVTLTRLRYPYMYIACLVHTFLHTSLQSVLHDSYIVEDSPCFLQDILEIRITFCTFKKPCHVSCNASCYQCYISLWGILIYPTNHPTTRQLLLTPMKIHFLQNILFPLNKCGLKIQD
jgi:hypothetical protein